MHRSRKLLISEIIILTGNTDYKRIEGSSDQMSSMVLLAAGLPRQEIG